ncbi:monocarboxylate transporter 12-like [Centruroides sculpturatus]|uniref:monocarboxylate transporter 12-like n=1 Tax=Centruroides sculpturatus TaxID=218467 RepID=UPI000C6EB233|nr:monocarboxylate transporter 12-like [Centruroides sculpturatus]
MLTVISMHRASGVFYTALMKTYGISREQAAWPFFLRKPIAFFMGTLVGVLISSVSIKTLILFGVTVGTIGMATLYFVNDILSLILIFGLFHGIGSGLVRMCNVISINNYFSKYRTVALGIMLAGISTGAFIFPPLIELCIDEYGLRGTFLILTGVILQGFIGALLYRNLPKKEEPKPEVNAKRSSVTEFIRRRSFDTAITILENNSPNRKENSKIIKPIEEANSKENIFYKAIKSLMFIFSIPMYHVIWISYAIFDISFSTFITIIVDHGMDCGIDEHQAVFFLSSLSIAELCGRLGGGWIVDLNVLSRKNFVRIGFLLMAVMFVIIPLLKNFIVLLAITAAVGILGSCILINGTTLYTEYLGLERLPLAAGSGSTISGLIGLATPKIIGYFRDSTNSYNTLFYKFSGFLFLSSFLWIAEPIFVKLHRSNSTVPETLANENENVTNR